MIGNTIFWHGLAAISAFIRAGISFAEGWQPLMPVGPAAKGCGILCAHQRLPDGDLLRDGGPDCPAIAGIAGLNLANPACMEPHRCKSPRSGLQQMRLTRALSV